MCGIAGFLSREPGQGRDQERIAEAMSAAIINRGPDDWGVWTDAAAGYAVGFRRLSIIDLTPAAHQPMLSASGRYVIVFNGEMYNFEEVRGQLPGKHRFRGHSDTEVILAAVEEWGLEESLGRFNGMFALALWDTRERVLHLARDRFGKKPMYYGWMGGSFLFGSELKALREHPDFRGEVDRDALALYLRHGCVPAPYSIYRNVAKLSPGSILSVTAERMDDRRFWSPAATIREARANPFQGSEAEAVDALDALLRDAVRIRMISDVPLGAFLSGGIDSSTVVGMMQAQSSRPVRTFTIGFEEEAFDEAKYAKAVARHLGTDHTELYVSDAETLAVVPELPLIFDEPFADSSQIPTYLVSRLARSAVTVSLSGDGGDELFAGYERYPFGKKLWRGTRLMPPFLREPLRLVARGIPPAFRLGRGRRAITGDRIRKAAEMVSAPDARTFYRNLLSHWKSPTSVVRDSHDLSTVFHAEGEWLDSLDLIEQMMFLDTASYLPDDILTKVDRASMAVSLEARAPFLDPRIFRFAWSLPLSWKLRNGRGKQIVRAVLDRYVPSTLVERPKQGFGVPLASWLRGPLRDWAEDLLAPARLEREGFFDSAAIGRKWNEHQRGIRSWHHYLWDVLMFQAWLAKETGRTGVRGTEVARSAVAASQPLAGSVRETYAG